jgi:hypothetical protein
VGRPRALTSHARGPRRPIGAARDESASYGLERPSHSPRALAILIAAAGIVGWVTPFSSFACWWKGRGRPSPRRQISRCAGAFSLCARPALDLSDRRSTARAERPEPQDTTQSRSSARLARSRTGARTRSQARGTSSERLVGVQLRTQHLGPFTA